MYQYVIIGLIVIVFIICVVFFMPIPADKPHDKELKKYYDELAVNPNSATAYMEIARDNITGYPKPYDTDKALADISKAIELDPNLAEAYCLRAILYYDRLDKIDLALYDLNKALELDPKDILAYMHRADIYYEQEKYDLALKDIDSVLEIDPKDKYAKSMKESINSLK